METLGVVWKFSEAKLPDGGASRRTAHRRCTPPCQTLFVRTSWKTCLARTEAVMERLPMRWYSYLCMTRPLNAFVHDTVKCCGGFSKAAREPLLIRTSQLTRGFFTMIQHNPCHCRVHGFYVSFFILYVCTTGYSGASMLASLCCGIKQCVPNYPFQSSQETSYISLTRLSLSTQLISSLEHSPLGQPSTLA